MTISPHRYGWLGGDYVRGEYPADRQDHLDNEDGYWIPEPKDDFDNYPAYIRYGLESTEPINPNQTTLLIDNTYHQPNGVGSLKLRWGVDDSVLQRFTMFCVTRSAFGTPVTPNDGERIVAGGRSTYVPAYDIDTGMMLWSIHDNNLQQGRWYYYTFFVKTGPKSWVPLVSESALVPIDYGHTKVLWDSLPSMYKVFDAEVNTSDDMSDLRRMFDVLGWQMDYQRTMAETLTQLWSADLSPSQVFTRIGTDNFGLDYSPSLGEARFRGLTAKASMLHRMRGTAEGLRQFIASATGFDVSVSGGSNLLLVNDDSEFIDGVGHWSTFPGVLATKFRASFDSGTTIKSSDLTLLSVDDVQPPITSVHQSVSVLGHLPTGHGVLKLDPAWDGDVWKRDPENVISTRLAVVCGAGTALRPTSPKTTKRIERMPNRYGVPVNEGRRYLLSFNLARSGYRTNTNGERVTVTPDVDGNLTYGIIWYDRKAVPERVPFNDGFSAAFAGSYQVEPISIGKRTITSGVTGDVGEWTEHTHLFEAPDGAAFACPFVFIHGTNISARYLAGVILSEESLAGNIISEGSVEYFRLGHDPQQVGDDLLGDTDKFLGAPL